MSCDDLCVSDLTTWCRVQKLSTKPDGVGGQEAIVQDQLWVDYFSFWGDLDWNGGGKKQVMDRSQASTPCSISAYFDARLDSNMRILLDDGSVLRILDVDNRKQRNVVMDVKAEVGVGS